MVIYIVILGRVQEHLKYSRYSLLSNVSVIENNTIPISMYYKTYYIMRWNKYISNNEKGNAMLWGKYERNILTQMTNRVKLRVTDGIRHHHIDGMRHHPKHYVILYSYLIYYYFLKCWIYFFWDYYEEKWVQIIMSSCEF